MKKYEIRIPKKIQKDIRNLSEDIRVRFLALAEQLRDHGPIAAKWRNFSKLAENKYHCHLTYSYVACWIHDKKSITIEV
ncbi:MAG: hypothetical protein JW795_07120, partial [Chitinivibrionales bacterium]|nr:hypothetical protein [Chitinivibrionales bacterium]